MRRRHVVIARYVSARINTTLSAQREHGGEIPRNTGWLSRQLEVDIALFLTGAM